MSKPLLVLDLDETLIYGTKESLEYECDFMADEFFVYKRPFLAEFLKRCGQFYDLAIWSSGSTAYVERIARNITLPEKYFEFVWSQDRCTVKFDPNNYEYYYLKDLKKVKRKGFDLDRILIVEDTPRKVWRNYGNAVYISEFLGSKDDSELVQLGEYLERIKDEDSFRKIEKRHWRNKIEN